MSQYEESVLRERFHKVILGAHYSEEAAQGILDRYFNEYMKDIPAFVRMLESYEKGPNPCGERGDDED